MPLPQTDAWRVHLARVLQATVWNELLKADTPAFTAARPLAWVRCADARDAGLAVAFAARHKVKLSGRGAWCWGGRVMWTWRVGVTAWVGGSAPAAKQGRQGGN